MRVASVRAHERRGASGPTSQGQGETLGGAIVNIHDLLAPQRAAAIFAAAAAIATAWLPPLAMATNVTFTSSNCNSYVLSGTPPNQTVTCIAGSGGGGVPVCAPTANPPTPKALEPTTVSANCSNQPTSYTWTGACPNAGATCAVIMKKPGSFTLTVKATNASGT